jgi:hypothetical protein
VTTLRIRALGALCLAVLSVTACDDPFEQVASRPTVNVVLESWALTGAPPAYPTALVVPLYSMIRADAAATFDIAFDIDADGRLMVLPVSKVVSAVGGDRTIGIMRGTGTYSSIVEAPRTGWVYDSIMTVNPGATFLVRVQTLYCQFDFRQDIYAKFYVDSVIPEERRIRLLGRVNPNCGYRSLLEGIPEY